MSTIPSKVQSFQPLARLMSRILADPPAVTPGICSSSNGCRRTYLLSTSRVAAETVYYDCCHVSHLAGQIVLYYLMAFSLNLIFQVEPDTVPVHEHISCGGHSSDSDPTTAQTNGAMLFTTTPLLIASGGQGTDNQQPQSIVAHIAASPFISHVLPPRQ